MMKSMTVRDAMHIGVETCDSSTTLREAVQRMTTARLRSLVIVDFDCALGGIISESDIVTAQLLGRNSKAWDQVTVGEIMTDRDRVMTVTPDMELREAAKIMVAHRIHRVVVAERDDMCNPTGMLSMGDIMRYMGEDAMIAPSPVEPAAKKAPAKKAATKKAPAKRK
jgi:CBS domain-containing protein